MTIVAAVDRSDRATAVAREAQTLAAAFDDEVHVVCVLTQAAFVELADADEPLTDVTEVEVRDAARAAAAEVAADLDVPAEAVGLMGNPAAEVLEYARERDARYVVIGSRNRSPVGKALFGSVAQSILLGADRPVVSVGDRDEAEHGR